MAMATGATGGNLQSGTGWLAATEAAWTCNQKDTGGKGAWRRTCKAGPPMRIGTNRYLRSGYGSSDGGSVISDVTGRKSQGVHPTMWIELTSQRQHRPAIFSEESDAPRGRSARGESIR